MDAALQTNANGRERHSCAAMYARQVSRLPDQQKENDDVSAPTNPHSKNKIKHTVDEYDISRGQLLGADQLDAALVRSAARTRLEGSKIRV